MKRQGLLVRVKELRKLAKELEEQEKEMDTKDMLFQINIINKSGLSDEWRIEE